MSVDLLNVFNYFYFNLNAEKEVTHAFFCLSLCGELKGNVSYGYQICQGPSANVFSCIAAETTVPKRKISKWGPNFLSENGP